MKEYLGDSVYIDFDGYYYILTIENDDSGPSDRILFEPQVIAAFDRYRKYISAQFEKRVED